MQRWCTIGAMQVYISMLTACDRVSIVCRHDFLGILEPYMMEEKKGLVDFLRTAVGCFRDLPRGHIISLAQHMQQVLLFISLGLCCAVLCCAVLSCICYVYDAPYMLCCLLCMLCIICHPMQTIKAGYCIPLYAFLERWATLSAIALAHTKSRLVHTVCTACLTNMCATGLLRLLYLCRWIIQRAPSLSPAILMCTL